MSDPSCRGIRELLGVYVVGAIEPAERGVVDGHLSHCRDCLEELAGLAGLPALLRRVPLADAERLASPGARAEDFDDPRPELLNSLLRRVAVRRRTRRLRAVFATAAALLIAVGAAGAVTHALAPHQVVGPASVSDRAQASGNGLAVTIKYGPSSWGPGTDMWARATGIRLWTTCKFWVLTTSGQRLLVGGWTVGPGADQLWYPAETSIPPASLTGFEITSGSRVLLRIPAVT